MVAEGNGVIVKVRVAVGRRVAGGGTGGRGVRVELGVMVTVGVLDGLSVWVGLGVRVKVLVGVAVEVRVLVDVAVGLAESDLVAFAARALVGVWVDDGELEGVADDVLDGLVVARGSTEGRRVTVAVGVGAISGVSDACGVSLGIAEGSGELVGVGVGVLLGSGDSSCAMAVGAGVVSLPLMLPETAVRVMARAVSV